MSVFPLCPEPGTFSFFRRLLAYLRPFFSREDIACYGPWYTNPAGNLNVRVCMFRRKGLWIYRLQYRKGTHPDEYIRWYKTLPGDVICPNRFTGRISRRRTYRAACRMAEQLTTLRYRFGL
ncbi:hypothetical protein [Escherichia coli]|uniref:hypothetical protein n=1 Tax=Escherichia coli TaxID=562 RepID=UPI0010E9126D|nr:hypothetical protein [Escherichia coli]GDM23556.1 hypothetical protein BvCmsNSNP012_04842 [Escherichia coli]